MTTKTYLTFNPPLTPCPDSRSSAKPLELSSLQPWMIAVMRSRQRQRHVRDYC